MRIAILRLMIISSHVQVLSEGWEGEELKEFVNRFSQIPIGYVGIWYLRSSQVTWRGGRSRGGGKEDVLGEKEGKEGERA
eukprot:125366-Hanusia_phi.AAC.3